MRGALAAFVVFAALLAAWTPVPTPATPGSGPAAVGEIVVGRYDLQRTGVASDVGAITSPIVRWTFRTNGTIATSPLAADLDGDGAIEIFLGEFLPTDAADGSRQGYVLDGQGHLEHSVPMRFNGVAAAAADLDGDGRMEFLFSEGSHSDVSGGIGYAAFNGEDGTPLWTFTTPFFGGEGFFASPALTDVDGDGRLDLIAGSMDHTVYALRGADASVLWRTPGLEHYVRHSTPMADLDGDGDPDVTVQTEAGTVHTFDAVRGTESWSRDLGDIVASTPAIGDLDGDGRLDLVYALVVQGGHVALSGDGDVLWRNEAHDFAYRSPALVDVDGDGLVDVVDGDSDDPSITAYRGTDGSVLWEMGLAAPWASGPIVAADTDGDGAMEILAGSDAGLTALDAATGATEWFLPLPSIRGEPLVKDVDGDGLAEILVGAGDGQLYVLGTPEPADATLRVEPRTLNLGSKGRWVNAHLTFDEPVAKDVVAESLRLEGIPADRVQVHGTTTIHAKFSREALVKILEPGDRVEVCATGVLTDGRTFRACDTIRVLGAKK
jgi:outer membrane protein assembly factor BamB